MTDEVRAAFVLALSTGWIVGYVAGLVCWGFMKRRTERRTA